MKAAVLRAPKVLEVGDIATPEAQPGELILAIRASTVCGTDLRILTGKKTKGVRFPSIIGHLLRHRRHTRPAILSRWHCGE